MFGKKQLQNDVFCLTEERDFFQGKYLEQVSEITAMKEQLKSARKEVDKLRQELMHQSTLSLSHAGATNANMEDDASSLTSEGNENQHIDAIEESEPSPQESKEITPPPSERDDDSAKDIRQSAEKLLQWASYRSSVATTRTVTSTLPDQVSISSPTNNSQLLESVPCSIHSSESRDHDESEDEESFEGESDHEELPASPTRASRLLDKIEKAVTSL